MDRNVGAFRHAGTFDIPSQNPASPANELQTDLMKLCVRYGYLNVRDELHEFGVRSGMEENAVRYNRHGKVITETRSAGAKRAWETRNAVDEYLRIHPTVTREAAFEAVTADRQHQNSDEPRNRPGQRRWDTRVDREIARVREETGVTITREEAGKRIAARRRAA